jgi:hypothetical protein
MEPGQATEEQQDTGRGGVRLAQESVIQIVGRFDPEADEIELSDLFRYTQVTEITADDAASMLATANILYTGSGVEYYQHPDDINGTTAEVRFAPTEAVLNALNHGQKFVASTKSGGDDHWQRISINFCGGKDAQVLEVLEAGAEFARLLREEKRIVTHSTIIEFRSISDEAFPVEASCVTVVAVRDDVDNADDPKGQAVATAAAIGRGEVYRSQATGKYYTLLAEHINTAVE